MRKRRPQSEFLSASTATAGVRPRRAQPERHRCRYQKRRRCSCSPPTRTAPQGVRVARPERLRHRRDTAPGSAPGLDSAEFSAHRRCPWLPVTRPSGCSVQASARASTIGDTEDRVPSAANTSAEFVTSRAAPAGYQQRPSGSPTEHADGRGRPDQPINSNGCFCEPAIGPKQPDSRQKK